MAMVDTSYTKSEQKAEATEAKVGPGGQPSPYPKTWPVGPHTP